MDGNQPEIVKAFRALGCTVAHTHRLGQGFPDICVGYGGLSMLIEIKDGSKPKSAQELTDDEREFQGRWTGGVRMVRNLDDVSETVSTLRRWHAAITRASCEQIAQEIEKR